MPSIKGIEYWDPEKMRIKTRGKMLNSFTKERFCPQTFCKAFDFLSFANFIKTYNL